MTLKVNGAVIPERAILTEMKRLMDFYSQHMAREELGRHAAALLKRAKDQAIGTKLLIAEVKRLGIEVSDADVDVALQDMIKKAGGEPGLDEVLARQQLTREQLRQSIRAGKQLDRLVTRITSGVPNCTEDELRAHYEEHRQRYTTPDRAQVRHILIKPASGQAGDKAAARSRLLDLKRQLEEGADFGHLAAAHSECPSGKESGGNLGWISEGTTVPEFDSVVFDMELGDISDVFETPLGCHIVEKMDEEQGEPLPFEAAEGRMRELLMHERCGRALTEYVNRLKANATIEDDDADAGNDLAADQP